MAWISICYADCILHDLFETYWKLIPFSYKESCDLWHSSSFLKRFESALLCRTKKAAICGKTVLFKFIEKRSFFVQRKLQFVAEAFFFKIFRKRISFPYKENYDLWQNRFLYNLLKAHYFFVRRKLWFVPCKWVVYSSFEDNRAKTLMDGWTITEVITLSFPDYAHFSKSKRDGRGEENKAHKN